jgi:hypothetical protein
VVLIGGAGRGAAGALKGGDAKGELGAIAGAAGVGFFQDASAVVFGNELKFVCRQPAKEAAGFGSQWRIST